MKIPRRTALFAGVGLGAVALGAVWSMLRQAQARPDPAAVALTARRFERPEGGELDLSGLRGQRLVVNFWAAWCAPCIREMPELDRFHKAHAAQGWQTLGLALDHAQAVRKFLARNPVSFPIGLVGDGGGQLLESLGNPQAGLPFTVMILPDGRVTWRRLGETSLDELTRQARAAA